MCESKREGERPTKAWYLVSVMFGVVGGVVGYFAVKDDEQKMANELLKIGVYVTIAVPLFYLLCFTGSQGPFVFIPPNSTREYVFIIFLALVVISIGAMVCLEER